MSRASMILTVTLLEVLSSAGPINLERALARAERRLKRIPKPPKPDTPLNIAAKKRLAAIKAARGG